MRDLLIKITRAFEKNHIQWAIGGSQLLSFYGITESVNDLDLLVALEDHDKACSVLLEMGTGIGVPHKSEYLTERFSRFMIDDIEIDLMSDFRIAYDGGVYDFVLDDRVRAPIEHQGIRIPVTSLEQWYIAYLLMIRREKKVEMLEEYFIRTSDIHMDLLDNYARRTFPKGVQDRIDRLIRRLEKEAL